MPAISVGSVEVDVLPNAQGIEGRLRAALVPPASQIGDEVGRIIGRQIVSHLTTAVRDGINDGAKAARPAATRQGDATAGDFARAMRARLEAAFKAMPKLDVKLSDTGIDADLARLRARLEALSGKRIGIDIDATTARAQAADIEERLRRLGAAHPNVAVRADTAAAIAQLQALQAQIDELTANPAQIRVETDGQLGTRLREAVKQAEASLPNVNIGADTTEAEVEIARLRAQLTALSTARVGIDIDAATALARVTEIQARLARLSSENPNIGVRVDAAAAAAQLAAFQAQVNRLDGQNARVGVDTSSAVGSMNNLVFAAIALGPAILPVLPVIAAGLGAVAAAATAAGAGIGGIALVAVPAFKQIGTVLQAQKAAQQASTDATYKGAQASSQGASKALQMAGAQQALATAERNGAQQIASAQQQVKQAKQAVADAIVQAGQRTQQAERQVEQAETSLAQAQKSATQAQKDLVSARQEASRQLQDMNNQLADSQLAERDAALQVKVARQNLNAVNASGSKATALQREQAQLQYDQALQNLKEQQLATKRQSTDTAAANKAGVKGSQTYTSAQDKLTQAQQNVAAQTQALKDAQDNQAQVAVQNARSISDAQQKVADSERNVATAQQNAADSIASAQRQIASASASAAGGVDQAAVAQAKYQAALDKLTPSARDTLTAFVDLRTVFGNWSKALQPAVMPLFTRALVSLRNTLPTLTPFVTAAAAAVTYLQDRVSASVKSPFWQSFKKDLQGSVTPAVVGLGVTFGNIIKGMAGIVDAFLPHMNGISITLQRVTGRFANWATGLKGSPEFERFLAYSADKGPLLASTLGKIAGAFLNVSQALSPLTGPLLTLLGGTAAAIGIIADKAPWFILLIYGIIVATKLWAIAQVALNFAMSANPFVLIGLAILALVGFVIYAYNRFSWFRTAVLAVWSAIQTAVLFVWNTVLKPVFTAIWTALQTVGRWALWLWTNAIGPAFRFIWEAAKILLTALVVLAILPIIAAIKILGAIGGWLWTHVFGPVFGWIGAKALWLYDHAIKPAWGSIAGASKGLWVNYLKPAFTAIWGALQTLGGWAEWLYKNAIKPAWDKIVSVIKTAYKVGVKPVFDAFSLLIKGLSGWFADAVGAIKTQWDKLKAVAKAPVQFIVDTVYNNGIRGVWNKVAGAFGAPKLGAFKFASGGIMPGYTPGRDVHQFVSPTGGTLGLSGGEAIMRPEFTRAVGSGFVGYFNKIAKSQGAQGVKAALAPVFGGNPKTSTDRSLKYASGGIYPRQSFADGGIFGWIGKGISAVSGAGSDVWNAVKKGASWLGDTLEASARAGVKHVVDPLLSSFPGMDTGFGRMLRAIPDKIVNAIFGYSKEADKKGAGGVGGPKIQAALNWAKAQAGKPYIWGGVGPKGFDCSGFMGAIENVLRGLNPNRRRWATGAFSGKTAPPGWVYHGNSPFRIGITNAGVGHTAGTLGKTNVESRGGAGVIVGSRARGYNNGLFGSWYGFQPGKYDSGGYLQPGMNLAFNGTGRPEPVFTSAQANALSSLANQTATQQLGDVSLNVWVGNEGIASIARAEVHNAQGELIQVLNAS
ncbi:hypothetical protein ACIRU8_39700 [Streptomyces sp. NPDC101175]|uniref:hypothetical protein n=1 Tax=Streptomyces sp. NPDC101175 TaxID=3366123 RepID=UPI0038378D10